MQTTQNEELFNLQSSLITKRMEDIKAQIEVLKSERLRKTYHERLQDMLARQIQEMETSIAKVLSLFNLISIKHNTHLCN